MLGDPWALLAGGSYRAAPVLGVTAAAQGRFPRPAPARSLQAPPRLPPARLRGCSARRGEPGAWLSLLQWFLTSAEAPPSAPQLCPQQKAQECQPS